MITRQTKRHLQTRLDRFEFEKLEARNLLSTGATFLPSMAPQFTGVVDYSTAGGGRCTATLLADGRHILTAAHCVDGDDNGVADPGNHGFTFELSNGDITFTVPGSQITIAPGWNGTTKNGGDIAIAALLEIGAGGKSNGHDLYRMNNEVGQTYTAVGYGQSGSSGNVGNSNPGGIKRSFQNEFDSTATRIKNEVKSVEVAATGGTFRLQFGGNNTGNIAWNAGTGAVQAALNALPSIAGVGGATNVFGGPGLWFVNFVGSFAGNDVGNLGILGGGLVGATVADVDTEIDGGEYGMPGNEGLLYDFDNGMVANDALGQLYGLNDLGLGNLTEAIQSPGDSGSPFFLGAGNLIAGVVSRRETGIGRGGDPIQQPVDVSDNDSTFGEIGVLARVFAFTAFIDSQIDDNNIDLVLNMDNQNEGNDGLVDTIEARINGGLFELLVNGQLFYQDMPGQIASLTVNGSSDADTLIISDPFGFDVSFDGAGGSDVLDQSALASHDVALTTTGVIDGFDGTTSGVVSMFENVNGLIGSAVGATDQITGLNQAAIWVVSGGAGQYMNGGATTDLMNFENYQGGSDSDLFRMPVVIGPLMVDGNGGNDTLQDVSGTPNDFEVSGTNSGNLNSAVAFDSIENLLGGANVDTFAFAGGDLAGFIDGRGGEDTFDFSNGVSENVHLTGPGAVDGLDGTLELDTLLTAFRNIDWIKGSLAGTTDTITGIDLDAVWNINNSTASYTINPTLDLENFEVYTGGAGVDQFNVQATDTPIMLLGEGNDDVFTLSSNAPALTGHVSDINETVNVDGGTGNNRLRAIDFAGPGNLDVAVFSGWIFGLAPADIFFSGTFDRPGSNDGIWIKGSDTGVDNFRVESLKAGDSLRIDAHGGDDQIRTSQQVLGDMQLDGGEDSDLVNVSFIDSPRRVNAHDSGVAGDDTLDLYGLLVTDELVVRPTSVARNILDRVWHDANTEKLIVRGFAGDDLFNFAGSDASHVIVQGNHGQDFMNLINTGNAANLEIGMGLNEDIAVILATNANTNTLVNGQKDADRVFVGSVLSQNNGSLDRIQGPLTLIAGPDEAGEDRLYVNDRDTATGQIYDIKDSHISSLSPRTFSSFSHYEFEVVRVDGTDQADEFQVTPSPMNRFVIDGNLPAQHDINCAAEGDFLNLAADPDTGRRLTLTDRSNGAGAWTFDNGFQGVHFMQIERFNHVARLAIGSDAFEGSVVRVLDAETRSTLFNLLPFESTFTGGVRVATGDITGDGIPDIIAGSGPGRVPEVRIYDGLDGQFVDSFVAHDQHMWDGILLATGDVSGNCGVDIVTTSGPGPAHAEIRVFRNTNNGFQMVDHFLPFGPYFTGGADVTVADFDGDGHKDIAAGALHGRGHVAVFDGTVPGGGYEIARFQAFADDFYGGVHITAGDVIGSDRADLIVSTGFNAWHSQYDSKVHIFDGTNLAYTPGTYDVPDADFYAFEDDQHPEASTRIAAKDYDLDGAIDELFASQGAGGEFGGRINIFQPPSPNAIDAFFEGSQPFYGGMFIG